jgi:hypothetical protein
VGEVQLVPRRLEDMVTHHLLDRLRRAALVHAGGGAEKREVERAPDDRGHRGQLLTTPTEAVEPPGNEIPHARGQRQRAGLVPGALPPSMLIEVAHRLNRDEGIALAHGPDPLLHQSHRRRLDPGASERSHEQSRVRS